MKNCAWPVFVTLSVVRNGLTGAVQVTEQPSDGSSKCQKTCIMCQLKKRMAFVVVSDGLCGSDSPSLSLFHVSVPNATKIHQRLLLKKIILLLGRSLSYNLLMSVLGSITACLLSSCSL